MLAKAEVLPRGPNPRFVVTLLSAQNHPAQPLYEQICCARGEMKNRIEEQQLDLFAHRTLGIVQPKINNVIAIG